MNSSKADAASAITITLAAASQGTSVGSETSSSVAKSESTSSAAAKLVATSGCASVADPANTASLNGGRARSTWDQSTRSAIAFSTSSQSAAVWHIGPILSIVQESAIAPSRLTVPYVGRSPDSPLNDAGQRIDPHVSVPMAKGTHPAATADPEPLDEPPAQESGPQAHFPGPLNAASGCS